MRSAACGVTAMTFRRPGTLAAAAVLATACVLLTAAPPAPASPRPAGPQGIRGQLAAAVNAQRRKLGIPGVIVMAQDPELGLWTGTFGTANRGTGQPMRAADHFRMGSITKTFVGTVVLQLVAEHRLSLNDRLSTWVPSIPDASQITIRELLNHTSGIRDYEDNPVLLRAIAHQPLRVWTPGQLVQLALYKPPVFPPGTEWSYSNTNYLLLGIIVSKVTGHSLGYEIGQRVLGPLSLLQTSFPVASPDLPRPFSHGYAPAGITGPPLSPLTDYTRWSPSWDFAAGNMISTAPDLLRWGTALGKGTLLSPAMRAAQRTWVKIAAGAWYGLGLARMKLDGEYLLGHDGADPGYSADLDYAPRLGLTLVVLANRCCTADYSDLILQTAATMIINWERAQSPARR
jgi:D-alanyl-D-alanine carboxypeptidase